MEEHKDDENTESDINIEINCRELTTNVEPHEIRRSIKCIYCLKKGSKGCKMDAMEGWEENIDGEYLIVYKCKTCQSMILK